MRLFLTIVEIVFALAGAALMVRGAWLLLRGAYRFGFTHMALALVGFLVATGFHFARGLFIIAS